MSCRLLSKIKTRSFGKVLILVLTAVCVLSFIYEYFLNGETNLAISSILTTQSSTTVDKQTKLKAWAEDSALNESPVTNHMTVSNASRSVFYLLNRKPVYRLGEEIHVLVDFFDGYGQRKTKGGDMVRVWMRDSKNKSSSAALVRDNHNGSYTATLVAFWSGMPEIKAVLIHPKEVIDTCYRRRYKFPQVRHVTAIFEHPVVAHVQETTSCNMDDAIPNYSEMCNLTRENYGSSMYCVKPSNRRLQCSDWTKLSWSTTWPGNEPHLTSAEKFLLQPENKAIFLPGSIVIQVKENGEQRERLIENSRSCFEVDARTLWNRETPIGYFYKGVWYDRLCTRRISYEDFIMKSCIRNRSMYLLGDSTLRQWHHVIQDRTNCTFVTDTWQESHLHRPVTCVDRGLNFILHWAPHDLPFDTRLAQKRYFKPIAARLDDINGEDHPIVVINVYSHCMAYHSRVFYSRMVTIRDAIIRLFQRFPNATVAIKGPHCYSFEKQMFQSLWMLDKYAEVYKNITRDLFNNISNRVIYLDGMDLTISAETNHVHPSREIAAQMVDDMFSKICP